MVRRFRVRLFGGCITPCIQTDGYHSRVGKIWYPPNLIMVSNTKKQPIEAKVVPLGRRELMKHVSNVLRNEMWEVHLHRTLSETE